MDSEERERTEQRKKKKGGGLGSFLLVFESALTLSLEARYGIERLVE